MYMLVGVLVEVVQADGGFVAEIGEIAGCGITMNREVLVRLMKPNFYEFWV